MWYQAAAMVWFGGIMFVLPTIGLMAYEIVMQRAIIIDRKGILIATVYNAVGSMLIFNGLAQLV